MKTRSLKKRLSSWNAASAEFLERCLGKVFRVEGFDENGQWELWATEKGNRRKVCRGPNTHTIWIEPEHVEPFPKPLA